MNTPTPRTDAEVVFPSCNDSSDTSHPQGTHVTADFARELERELAIERAKVKVLREACCEIERYAIEGSENERLLRAALAATEDKP